LGELNEKLPHIFGGVKENFYAFAGRMQRIPNIEEAVNLLKTAVFGLPAQVKSDGTIIVSSFSVSQPSSTQIIKSFDYKEKFWKPDLKGTDDLVRNLLVKGGFLPEDRINPAILSLKWGKKESFNQMFNPAVTVGITGPKKPEKVYKNKTAYSYQIKTIHHLPHPVR